MYLLLSLYSQMLAHIKILYFHNSPVLKLILQFAKA